MIKTFVEDGKTYAEVKDLKTWENNPRDITEEEFEKLKESLAGSGGVDQIHNLLVNQDGIVLGGNMRLRAFKDLGIKNVWVDIRETKDEKQMFDYAMKSNMSSGSTNEQKLTLLAHELKLTPMELKWYTVNLGEPKPIDLVVNGPDFEPGDEEDQSQLDQRKMVTCPECGHEFHPEA